MGHTTAYGFRDPKALRQAARISLRAAAVYGVFAGGNLVADMAGMGTILGFGLGLMFAIVFAGFGLLTMGTARVMDRTGMPAITSAALTVALVAVGSCATTFGVIALIQFYVMVLQITLGAG